jgi:hypothetical protein
MRLYHFLQAAVGVEGLRGMENRRLPVSSYMLRDVSDTVRSAATEQSAPGGADIDDLVLPGGLDRVYDEEAFQYFLEIERKRSEIRNEPFPLMLIDVRTDPGMNPRRNAAAAKLFVVLARCLRETDFFGWYRQDCIVGAVLTQHGTQEVPDLCDVVRRRIGGELDRHRMSRLACALQVRIDGPSLSVISGSE